MQMNSKRTAAGMTELDLPWVDIEAEMATDDRPPVLEQI